MTLHLYGFFVGLGIVAGIIVVEKINKKILTAELFSWIIIPAIFGARIYHVIDYWQYYQENLWQILYLWQGGLAIYGSIIGGFIGLWFYSKLKKINIFAVCDVIAIGLPIGQAIGRLGNFFNKELYGLPTSLPWGIYINNKKYHPLFSYEAIWDILIFIVLIILIKTNKKRKTGFFFFSYLGLYSFGRFWLDFLRIDPWKIGTLAVSQYISLIFLAISLYSISYVPRKN